MSTSVIVLDCNTSSLGLLCEEWSKEDLIKRLVASVIVYSNTHLSMSVNNHLLIVAASAPLKNRVIFSSEAHQKDADIAEAIDLAIRNAIQSDAQSGDRFVHTNYANAFATGICYFSRFKKGLNNAIGRVIVINLSEVSHEEQARLMNLFLSAQQMDLKFHVCSLAKTNSLLRQACDITGGIHRQVEEINSVLQFLIASFIFGLAINILIFSVTAWEIQNRHRICLSFAITKESTIRLHVFAIIDPSHWDLSARFAWQFIVSDVRVVWLAERFSKVRTDNECIYLFPPLFHLSLCIDKRC
ncbi:hypothetical protein M3Y97_00550500 [Aphelenchoides bicaudatus]|nr:hypothetical protein M3Y97_00550500 [Aphelenchoides bicaudatus]